MSHFKTAGFKINDFFKPENIEITADAIRQMAAGCTIAEYGMIKIQDVSRQELKNRVLTALRACRRVQAWFIDHPDASPEYKAIFKHAFLDDKMVVVGEILTIMWKLDNEGLETLKSELERCMEQNESVNTTP